VRITSAGLLIVAVALFSVPSCYSPGGGTLGQNIAGVWLGTCEYGEHRGIETAYITTYHADGTGMTTSSRALGAGDPNRYGLSTTHHMVWEQTGARTIRWRILHFGHEADGSIRYLSRTHGLMEFDQEFESCTGSFEIEVFEPEDLVEPLSPNDPDAVPAGSGKGACRAKRLQIQIE
jgi:hypothetical protein